MLIGKRSDNDEFPKLQNYCLLRIQTIHVIYHLILTWSYYLVNKPTPLQCSILFTTLNILLPPFYTNKFKPLNKSNPMLDYFHTRQQQSDKSPLIRKPHIDFGISIQTPQQFQKPFTMISRQTFVNPYLSYQKNRKASIPISKLKDINPNWTQKVDINQIQTQITFLNSNNHLGPLDPKNRYFKELSTSKTRFRLTKGQFTNFLERNHSKQLFGPLIGMERDRSKSVLTRTLIAKKSQSKLSSNFDKLTHYQSRMFQTKKPFQEKNTLRKTRFAFREGFKKQLEDRKVGKIGEYVLPQLSTSYSNMKYTLDSEGENPETTLLSDKSLERLQDLRDFSYTQRYFTLDVKSKDSKKFKEGKND